MGTTLAIFRLSGTSPDDFEVLKIVVRGFTISLAILLRTKLPRPSCPGLLFWSNFAMIRIQSNLFQMNVFFLLA